MHGKIDKILLNFNQYDLSQNDNLLKQQLYLIFLYFNTKKYILKTRFIENGLGLFGHCTRVNIQKLVSLFTKQNENQQKKLKAE